MDGTISSKVTADMDGYLIGWFNGIAKYRKNSLGMVGVKDGPIPTIVEWKDLELYESNGKKIEIGNRK